MADACDDVKFCMNRTSQRPSKPADDRQIDPRRANLPSRRPPARTSPEDEVDLVGVD
jgi:hypothetical protein